MKTFLKGIITTAIVSISVWGASAQTTIASWNFEKGTAATTSGTGTLAAIGGVTVTIADTTGISSTILSSSDTTILESSLTQTGQHAFGTTGYPSASSSNKSAGIQINVSTVGYKNIIFTMNMRHGNKCANTAALQYTTDGVTWIDATKYVASITDDTWFYRTFNFSNISGANNNANFGIRVVAAFAGTTSSYAPSNSSSKGYDSTKGFRFDNISLSGTTTSGIEEVTEITWKQTGNELNFGSITKSNIEVYNLTGIKVASSAPASKITLDLPQGIYIVKVGSLTKKIFIK